MKKILKISLLILLSIILQGAGFQVMGQPDPPGVPLNHGRNGNISNNAAPPGSGLEIFLILGMVYGIRNYRIRRAACLENDHP
ncbi:MAG: hypothetical protein WCL00_12615 [Bacteroidota bacterium]